MARRAIVLGVILTACAGGYLRAKGDDRKIVTFYSYNDGKAFESVITAKALEGTPEWSESNPNPPLPARMAMELADRLKDTLVEDTEDGEWGRVSTELRLATDNYWYWLVRYEFETERTGPPPDLILLVLMDGTVVTPGVYPERKFLTNAFGGPTTPAGHFFFSGTSVTDADLAHLKGMGCIQAAVLSSSAITDIGLRYLNELARLEALNVSSPKITDGGLKHVGALDELEYLTLQSPQITDAGLEHLAGMVGLRELWLEGCAVTGCGLEHLKGMENLEDLAVRSARIKGPGLEYLKGVHQLKSLDLEDNPIDDAGLVHLSGLTQLQTLTLGSTQVTVAGLRHLADLKQLVRLYLRDTEVTDEGLRVLQEALPDCDIIR